jgi:copper chaperone
MSHINPTGHTAMTRFHLEDMHCGRCEASVRRAVLAADPAAQLHVALGTRQIELTQSTLAPAEWEAVLREAGFEALPSAPAAMPAAAAPRQGCCCAPDRA